MRSYMGFDFTPRNESDLRNWVFFVKPSVITSFLYASDFKIIWVVPSWLQIKVFSKAESDKMYMRAL